jgi:hypothetical protein
MLVSENVLKWAMRFYPPMLFQRIWVKRFHPGFRGVEVKIFKSVFNINYNRSIFGGTIYAAADPFYAVLFYQLMLRKGYRVIVWQKAAEIFYLKPGRSDLYFKIDISVEEIDAVCSLIETHGKAEHRSTLEIKNSEGDVTARVSNLVYIRSLDSALKNPKL